MKEHKILWVNQQNGIATGLCGYYGSGSYSPHWRHVTCKRCLKKRNKRK